MRLMRLLTQFGFLAVLVQGLASCSVYMAANQPEKKDVGLLKPGTPRSAVLAELGAPIESTVRAGAKVDVFTFTQGSSGLEKGGRAVRHGAADVITLGLWEVVGTPIEGYANGTKVSMEITYDREDRVSRVVPLRGQEVLAKAD